VGETLIFNILKDAGYKYSYIDRDLKKGIRYRPYWEVEEYAAGIPVYHPVRRKTNDLFRRLVGIKAGYDNNFAFIPLIYAYRLYRNIGKSAGDSGAAVTPDETWYNP
jgi:hypothetical protein